MLNTVTLNRFFGCWEAQKAGHTTFTCKFVMAKAYGTLAKIYQITHPEDTEQHKSFFGIV